MSFPVDSSVPMTIEITGKIKAATKGCVLTLRLRFERSEVRRFEGHYDEILPLPGGCVPVRATLAWKSWERKTQEEIKIVDGDRWSDFWRDFEDDSSSGNFQCVVSYSGQGTSLTIVNFDGREFEVSVDFVNRLSVSQRGMFFVIPAAPERSDFYNRKYKLELECEGAQNVFSSERRACSCDKNKFQGEDLPFNRPLELDFRTGEVIKSAGNAALKFPKTVNRVAFFIEYTAQFRTTVGKIEREFISMLRDFPDSVFKQVQFTIIKYGERRGIFPDARMEPERANTREALIDFVAQDSQILFWDFEQALEEYENRWKGDKAVIVLLSRGITKQMELLSRGMRKERRFAHDPRAIPPGTDYPVVFADHYYLGGGRAIAKKYEGGYAFALSAAQLVSIVHRLMKRRERQTEPPLQDMMCYQTESVERESLRAVYSGVRTGEIINCVTDTLELPINRHFNLKDTKDNTKDKPKDKPTKEQGNTNDNTKDNQLNLPETRLEQSLDKRDTNIQTRDLNSFISMFWLIIVRQTVIIRVICASVKSWRSSSAKSKKSNDWFCLIYSKCHKFERVRKVFQTLAK